MTKRRLAVRGIIFEDGKLLCVQLNAHSGRTSSTARVFWCTPGGGVDDAEPLIAAMERELVEETGIMPVIGNLLYIQQFKEADQEHLELFFHIKNSSDYQHIDLSKTTHGDIEIAAISFVDPKTAYVLPSFLSSQDIASDIARGIPIIFDNL